MFINVSDLDAGSVRGEGGAELDRFTSSGPVRTIRRSAQLDDGSRNRSL